MGIAQGGAVVTPKSINIKPTTPASSSRTLSTARSAPSIAGFGICYFCWRSSLGFISLLGQIPQSISHSTVHQSKGALVLGGVIPVFAGVVGFTLLLFGVAKPHRLAQRPVAIGDKVHKSVDTNPNLECDINKLPSETGVSGAGNILSQIGRLPIEINQ